MTILSNPVKNLVMTAAYLNQPEINLAKNMMFVD